MNEDGTGLKQLTTTGESGSGVFSADGKSIFFLHSGDIWRMNADGSGQVNLSNTPEEDEGMVLSVAPDGTRIAYTRTRTAGIFTMKVDGTDRKRLTDRNDQSPSWSPDSKKIALWRIMGSIWVMNRDGSGLTQVVAYGDRVVYCPVFSPDGKQIAFSVDAPGGREIWVVNVDGSDLHRVHEAFGPQPTAQVLVIAWKKGALLVSGSWEGSSKPYLVPEAGGPAVRLLSGATNDNPTDWWVP